MSDDPADVLPPRILVVDDERQIHASVRLRLGPDYEMVSCLDAREALERVKQERFDLCITDLHMPHLDGFTFIERARERDPALGYVILSAFDTGENLRRAIPLQVFGFLDKPLPDREGFERRVPEWIARTRRQRRDLELAHSSRILAQELAVAQLAQEVELVASESARDALLQAANLQTTIHAHLVAMASLVATRAKTDATFSHLLRHIESARKTAEASSIACESFFNSSYASRDASPAHIAAGLRYAVEIARRISHAEDGNKAVDLQQLDETTVARGLSGIDFLLMMVPLIGVALMSASPASTVRITAEYIPRMEVTLKEPSLKGHLWLNRKHAVLGQPGLQLTISATAAPPRRSDMETWLRGEAYPFSSISRRGLITGLQKSRAAVACAIDAGSSQFGIVLALPV